MYNFELSYESLHVHICLHTYTYKPVYARIPTNRKTQPNIWQYCGYLVLLRRVRDDTATANRSMFDYVTHLAVLEGWVRRCNKNGGRSA